MLLCAYVVLTESISTTWLRSHMLLRYSCEVNCGWPNVCVRLCTWVDLCKTISSVPLSTWAQRVLCILRLRGVDRHILIVAVLKPCVLCKAADLPVSCFLACSRSTFSFSSQSNSSVEQLSVFCFPPLVSRLLRLKPAIPDAPLLKSPPLSLRLLLLPLAGKLHLPFDTNRKQLRCCVLASFSCQLLRKTHPSQNRSQHLHRLCSRASHVVGG